MPEPLKPNSSELTPIESIKTEAKFDPNAALDEAGFLEFLSAYDDADTFDMKDLPEIENRYNAFKRMKEISVGYKEIAKSKIQQEWDVKMSDADLRSLDDKLQEMAINRPKELEKFEASLKRFKELPDLILARQRELVSLGDKSQIEENKRELGISKKILTNAEEEFTKSGKFLRFLDIATFDLDLYRHKRKKMRDFVNRFGMKMSSKEIELKSKKLDSNIADAKDRLGKIDSTQKALDALVKEFDPLRKNIYGEIGAIQDIAEKIKDKVKKRIDAKINGDDIGKLIESQGDFVDLQERGDKSELGIKVFGDENEDLDASEYQSNIDENIEIKAFELIQAKIMNIEVNNREGVFSKLRKELAPVLEASTLGSKDAQATKEFVVTTLRSAIEGLGNDPDKKAKVLLLNRLIADYKK